MTLRNSSNSFFRSLLEQKCERYKSAKGHRKCTAADSVQPHGRLLLVFRNHEDGRDRLDKRQKDEHGRAGNELVENREVAEAWQDIGHRELERDQRQH